MNRTVKIIIAAAGVAAVSVLCGAAHRRGITCRFPRLIRTMTTHGAAILAAR